MKNSFLFELGTEEIPAGMIESAVEQLRSGFESVLAGEQVAWEGLSCFATPRRLAVLVKGLPERRPDREEVLPGPPRSVAFDRDGRPTPAAVGFARKMGVGVDQLELVETGRGEYLVFRRRLPGDAVPGILSGALPGIIASISWPKTMVWTESRFRFVRPLRWFVCLWNGEVVPFEFEGVVAGRRSRGHRLIGPPEVEVPEADSYVETLRSAFVLVDPAERRRRIEEGLRRESGELEVRRDQGLIETVVHLNEFPSVLRGSFRPSYLGIPAEVLVTVMRFHQKYFSLQGGDGRLAPEFLTVINTEKDPDGRIRGGHEKVLQARLEDAAFFWKTDRRIPLADRLDSLEHVLFQENLGSYLDKTRRLEWICRELSASETLGEAARLCKVDLTTEMVREFTELQGVMGGLYAREEGRPAEVWQAIYEHYRPISLDDDLPESPNGALLSIADRIDSIVGCFGVGLLPSGSSDPFALRRQAQGLVMLLLAMGIETPLERLVDLALAGFPRFGNATEVRRQVLDFLQRRLNFVLQREGLPQDVLKAVFGVGVGSVPDARERARALILIRSDADFDALAAAYKRIKNILAASEEDLSAVDPGAFAEEGEGALFSALGTLRPRVEESVKRKDYLGALRAIAAFRGPVDRFFDDVLVMAEEARLRRNRLALLRAVSELFLAIADVSEIAQRGGGQKSG
jgi:glycyl-tRNA synthetase beta chain